MVLCFQIASLQDNQIAKQGKPTVLENFQKTERNVQFVPEYNYRQMFFLLPGTWQIFQSDMSKASESTQWQRRVFFEQMCSAEEILSSSNGTSVVFFVKNEAEARKYSEYIAQPTRKDLHFQSRTDITILADYHSLVIYSPLLRAAAPNPMK
jgi:hypothetical protein